MSATEELLGRLHDAVAQKLLDKVEAGDATPAEISAAIKFLKDNNIEAEPTPDSTLTKLGDALPSFSAEDKLHVN